MAIHTYPNRAEAVKAQCAFNAKWPGYIWGVNPTPGQRGTWAVYVRNPGDRHNVWCGPDGITL